MARIHVLLCACIVLVLLATPCTAVRSLRGDQIGKRLSEEDLVPVKGPLKSGDDAVPTAAKVTEYPSNYNEWIHFQARELSTDYLPAAANPSVPCC